MTFEQTCQLVAGVQALWPHQPLGAETPGVWHPLLERFAAEDCEAAIRELATTGREFPPPVGVLVRTVTDRAADLPEWDEAWAEVQRLIRRRGSYNPPTLEDFSHPAVAAFAIPSWTELCLGPAEGTRDYGMHHAQQREAFKAMRSRTQRDSALAAIGAPRPSAARRPGLSRLDYALALPKGEAT